ncbi:MAG: BrnT family toxin [Elusimicrobia bacterium]|nr:BrnT family toxin [Elusimicrobiota bacterium]
MTDIVFGQAKFDWDEHNVRKNWKKHKVAYTECEEVFFDPGLKVLPDEGHSKTERRHIALGKTVTGRLLFVAFVDRGGKLRVISARAMSRQERRAYHEKIKEAS